MQPGTPPENSVPVPRCALLHSSAPTQVTSEGASLKVFRPKGGKGNANKASEPKAIRWIAEVAATNIEDVLPNKLELTTC